MNRASAGVLRFFLRHQILILCLVFFLALAGAELWLHTRPLPEYVTDFIFRQGADMSVHQPSSNLEQMFELKPGAVDSFVDQSGVKYAVSINSLGLRDPERRIPKPAGVFRIIMLGSSYSYGAMVDNDQTVAAYMEKALNENYGGPIRFEVVNAGVSSYGPAQMTAVARRLIALGCDPDLILFHVSLIGARGFLDDHIELDAYKKDPVLFREHFLLPFAETSDLWAQVGARSRLALLYIAHYNRTIPKDERERRVYKVTIKRHIEALNEFAADFSKIPMASVECPCLDDHDMQIERVMAQTPIDFDCLYVPKNTGEEYAFMHAPAHVHEYFAGRWIELLKEKKLIPAP